MEITDDTVTCLVRLNSRSGRRIVLNSGLACEFAVPNASDEQKTYYFFSEWYPEKNCPRLTCYADIVTPNGRGRLYVHNDRDLGKYSLDIVLYDGEKPVSMHSVSSFELR